MCYKTTPLAFFLPFPSNSYFFLNILSFEEGIVGVASKNF